MKPEDSALGQETEYSDAYNADLLFPILRKNTRKAYLSDTKILPFYGFDRWTAYEFSWLNPNGCPAVKIVEFDFPADSPAIIESKSFKLYLNSFNQSIFTEDQIKKTLVDDLSVRVGGDVTVRLYPVGHYPIHDLHNFKTIDDISIPCQEYEVNANLLKSTGNNVQKTYLKTDLFRSLCLVTAQPDWASVYIAYEGEEICTTSLLQYLVSYRKHQGFHEQCVELIYTDLKAHFDLTFLMVTARFLRRGGLDINPYRASISSDAMHMRLARQ